MTPEKRKGRVQYLEQVFKWDINDRLSLRVHSRVQVYAKGICFWVL